MAHLQLMYGNDYHLESLLKGLGYSSLTFEGDGMCNKWGGTLIS